MFKVFQNFNSKPESVAFIFCYGRFHNIMVPGFTTTVIKRISNVLERLVSHAISVGFH